MLGLANGSHLAHFKSR